MNIFKHILVWSLLVSSIGAVTAQNTISILSVPAGNEFAKINEHGTTILPSGRFLTPAGQLIRITNDPFGIALSPDGKKAVHL